MTGYGRSEGTYKGVETVVELRSINHRFSEVVIRLPKGLSELERPCKQLLQDRFSRGRIELTVSVNGAAGTEREIRLDEKLAGQYIRLLQSFKRTFRLKGEVEIGMLAAFKDLVTISDRPLPPNGLDRQILRLIRRAMDRLDRMRRQEGKALVQDLRHRLDLIEKALKRIEFRTPTVVQEHRKRLSSRIEALTQGIKLDAGRLAQEVALFADRCDISEERVRLVSHLDQFRRMMESPEPAGRSLDFLLQEMNREVNTIGSKANDREITGEVVAVKGEIEKIREQVQNIE
jgi:uncharacterized protein (TIGR00255 family)